MRLAGAVDIGGTRTKLGVVAEDGRIVAKATVSTTFAGDPLPLAASIAATLGPLLDAERAQGREVGGVGISVAGFLDDERGAMVGNANLPKLCGFPLRRELERLLKLECRLEVDSNAAVLAEFRFGAGRGVARLLGVTVGTGLGGGVIVNGRLLRHTGQCAGDLGHVIVDPSDAARLCTCGARGCLEATVCSAALAERAGGRRVREIVAAAQRGEDSAREALAVTGRWLGIGLASLAPLFAPDRIVIGGGVAAAGDLLLDPTRESFTAHAGSEFRDRVPLVGSDFGGWDGMVGAASQFLDPMA